MVGKLMKQVKSGNALRGDVLHESNRKPIGSEHIFTAQHAGFCMSTIVKLLYSFEMFQPKSKARHVYLRPYAGKSMDV